MEGFVGCGGSPVRRIVTISLLSSVSSIAAKVAFLLFDSWSAKKKEHYVIPTPTAPPFQYAANLAANPASLIQTGALRTNDMLLSDGIQSPRSASAAFQDHNYDNKDNVPSPADSFKKLQASGIVESKSFDIFTTLQEQDGRKGLFVDRGVGCTMFAKSFSSCSLASVLNFVTGKAMSEAAGAVAAAAVADQLHGSNEDRNLAIVLVGLRARGKTFTAVKLTRYLCELGHETRHFNVGKAVLKDLKYADTHDKYDKRSQISRSRYRTFHLRLRPAGVTITFGGFNLIKTESSFYDLFNLTTSSHYALPNYCTVNISTVHSVAFYMY
uniref:6-phosphofructo-2-kinase domain-containing protein n=1 Tax=Oryza brachyantha TaxID=4533 RepID=J3MS39_ORYBR